MKNNTKIWLSNKYVFVGLIILSIGILTTINNYYFYEYISVTNNRNVKKIEIMLDEKLALCADNNVSISACTNNIVSTFNKIQERRAYAYTDKIIIKDSRGNFIWKKAEYKHDRVATLSLDVQLPNLIDNHKANIKIDQQWSNSALMISVYRSMTFSLHKVIDKWRDKGNVEAIKYFRTTAWFRSRPALGYTIFTIFLFLLYRKRELSLTKEMQKHEEEIVKVERERLSYEHMNKTKDEIIKELGAKVENIGLKIQEHDKVINPPLNTLKYDQFLELDPESVIFKCRKVAEKLVIKVYNEKINSDDRITLHKRMERLSKDKIFDSKIVGYINSIKAFGNISAHPNIENPVEFTREDAVMVSNTLIRLIEELDNRNLLVE